MSRKSTKLKRRGLRNAVLGATIAKMISGGQLPPLPKMAKITWKIRGRCWIEDALEP